MKTLIVFLLLGLTAFSFGVPLDEEVPEIDESDGPDEIEDENELQATDDETEEQDEVDDPRRIIYRCFYCRRIKNPLRRRRCYRSCRRRRCLRRRKLCLRLCGWNWFCKKRCYRRYRCYLRG